MVGHYEMDVSAQGFASDVGNNLPFVSVALCFCLRAVSSYQKMVSSRRRCRLLFESIKVLFSVVFKPS